jgi:hypothetical protein
MKKMEYPVIIFFYEKKILKKMINLTNNIQLFLYSLIYMRNRIMRMYKKKSRLLELRGEKVGTTMFT